VRDVLSRQLDTLGVEADFVEDGKQALEALKTQQYGILFTDLHMPEMDGYELISEIRRKETESKPPGEPLRTFPVVVLTADVQMSQRQTYLSHGFDECLLKPVSLGQFRRLLMRWGLLDESDDAHTIEDEHEIAEITSEKQTGLPPAIDLKAMKAQMGSVDDSSIEMIHMFVEMTIPLIERIQTAYTHQDYHDLKEAAHSLKGGARSACCNVLGDLAAKLQNALDNHEACDELVNNIVTEFGRVRKAVKEL
jgi:CheY-like chemotaxis protein